MKPGGVLANWIWPSTRAEAVSGQDRPPTVPDVRRARRVANMPQFRRRRATLTNDDAVCAQSLPTAAGGRAGRIRRTAEVFPTTRALLSRHRWPDLGCRFTRPPCWLTSALTLRRAHVGRQGSVMSAAGPTVADCRPPKVFVPVRGSSACAAARIASKSGSSPDPTQRRRGRAGGRSCWPDRAALPKRPVTRGGIGPAVASARRSRAALVPAKSRPAVMRYQPARQSLGATQARRRAGYSAAAHHGRASIEELVRQAPYPSMSARAFRIARRQPGRLPGHAPARQWPPAS